MDYTIKQHNGFDRGQSVDFSPLIPMEWDVNDIYYMS